VPQRRHGPHGECRARSCLRIARQQQGLRKGNHRSGDRALQHTKENEQSERRRQCAQERGHDKEEYGGGEQLHLAESPGEPSGQRQRDRVRNSERGDDPRALIGRNTEIARNRRQGHVGDGGVQDVHERREGQSHRAYRERRAAKGRQLRRSRGRRRAFFSCRGSHAHPVRVRNAAALNSDDA